MIYKYNSFSIKQANLFGKSWRYTTIYIPIIALQE